MPTEDPGEEKMGTFTNILIAVGFVVFFILVIVLTSICRYLRHRRMVREPVVQIPGNGPPMLPWAPLPVQGMNPPAQQPQGINQQEGAYQLPPQYQQGTSAPPQYQQGTSAPPQYQQGTNAPPQYQQGTSAPPQYQQGTSAPPQHPGSPSKQLSNLSPLPIMPQKK